MALFDAKGVEAGAGAFVLAETILMVRSTLIGMSKANKAKKRRR